MKKKLTKVSGKYQRRYENKGILMYRNRFEPVEVPAGEFVEILDEYPDSYLCEYKGAVVRIPKDNFISIRTNRPARVERQTKKVRNRERELVEV